MSNFDFYVRYEYAFAAIHLVLAMLGMGATLTFSDFSEVLKRPRGLILGLILQIIGAPLVAWGFIRFMNLDPGLAIGLALCAAVAGGTTSNILTYFAKASVALSIVLTAISTLTCLVTVPIVLNVLVADIMPLDFEIPVLKIAGEIGIYLLLPLAVGMLVLRLLPKYAERISRISIRLALLTVVVIVIGAEGAGKLDREAFGLSNIAIVWIFQLALTAMSAALPLIMGVPRAQTAAINIEVSVRNINLALLIKASLFPAVIGVADPIGDFVLFTALLYAGASMLVGSLVMLMYRGHHYRYASA